MLIEDTKFPVAETFVSPQGEGLYAGTLMQFIRLAGCSVGKQFTPDEKKAFNVLNDYQTKCATFDGREFACDTNYKMSSQMSLKEIASLVEQSGVQHVCLTGGEPLMHKNIEVLLDHLLDLVKIHIETSGTIPIHDIAHRDGIWITVSPKKGCLLEELWHADEIKLLVDENLTDSTLLNFFEEADEGGPIVWLSPINDEHTIRQDNVQRCLDFMRKYPALRLTMQMHKIIGVR